MQHFANANIAFKVIADIVKNIVTKKKLVNTKGLVSFIVIVAS